MKKILFLLLLVCPLPLFSQTVNITFDADTTISAYLYREIDNCYNKAYPTDTIQLISQRPFKFKIDVKEFSYLDIQYSSGAHCTALLLPGNDFQISYTDKNVHFRGINQHGQSYFNTNFTSNLIKYIEPWTKTLEQYTNNSIDFNNVKEILQTDTVSCKLFKEIENLKQKKDVSTAFAAVMKENINLFKQGYNIQGLRTLLLSDQYKKKILKDSLSIMNTVDSLFSLYPNNEPEFIARTAKQSFGTNYLIQYYKHLFKKETRLEDSTDSNGNAFYLQAPYTVQAGLIGRSIIYDFKFGFPTAIPNSIHFLEQYPSSQYAQILKRYVNEDKIKASISTTIFNNISTLAQISDIKQLQGKYIFVDLWASWCIPCRKEFEFKDPLETLIHKFNNIEIVYISLDGGKGSQAWEKAVNKYSLSGIHIIANKELQKEIREKVFNGTQDNIFLPNDFSISNGSVEGNSITIPRYFLLDKEGKVVHEDLPRPSAMEQLNNVLEKTFNGSL